MIRQNIHNPTKSQRILQQLEKNNERKKIKQEDLSNEQEFECLRCHDVLTPDYSRTDIGLEFLINIL
ncbi:MAG TPA: hypothetical protein VFI73_04635 [Candidatus Nitrosopolaris sp.]|nr:hypothetical protein [Candidatus Nitrosopolaris sp.]